MLYFTFTRHNITSSFFAISKSTWWNAGCQKALITETFSKLSWTVRKVVYFNLIEKYVCAAYDPHNCLYTNKVNRLPLFLYTKSSDNKMEKLPQQAVSNFTFNVRCSLDIRCNIKTK